MVDLFNKYKTTVWYILVVWKNQVFILNYFRIKLSPKNILLNYQL